MNFEPKAKLHETIKAGERLWNSSPTAFLLSITWLFISYFALRRPHLPGVAIGLLAFAAGIASLRPDAKLPERLCWAAVLGVLLISEIKSLHADRAESDLQASKLRKEQDAKFATILASENQNFASTANQLQKAYDDSQTKFKTTISKLDAELKAERLTFEQTRLTAFVHVKSESYLDNPATGLPSRVQVVYENIGRETARTIHFLGRLYVGPADQQLAKEQIEPVFNRAWKEHVVTDKAGQLLSPGDPHLFSVDTGPYTETEISDMRSGASHSYFVVRIEYTDDTGTWISDQCDRSLAGRGTNCGFLGETRYRSSESQPVIKAQHKQRQ